MTPEEISKQLPNPEVIHTLPNGRKYRFLDTGREFKDGEYPSGGIRIDLWHNGEWIFLDYSPSIDIANQFLKSAARLSKL
jgi:hypothetical protein